MIQKIKNLTIAAFVSIFVLNACELDRIPESNLSDEIYWASDVDFQEAVNYLYQVSSVNSTYDHFPLCADIMSDNAISSYFNEIGNGTYLPGANFGPWEQDYRIIRAANNIIEKVNSAEFDSEIFNYFIAEARFFRAYAYADLIRRYGDVPMIMQTLDTDDDDLLYAPRTPVETLLETMYEDLDYAAINLPSKADGMYGMVSQGAALALKSRIALRRGTWNKFHTGANSDNHLQIAKEASLAVMQSEEYSLFFIYGVDSSYLHLFKIDGQGEVNEEAIWVRQYGFDFELTLRQQIFGVLAEQGNYAVSRSIVDAHLFMDGLPMDKSPLYEGQQNALSDFENRDPRLDGLVAKQGDPYTSAYPYIPNLTAPTGYSISKYHYGWPGGGADRYIDLMEIRYAEVLLNYVEASYELNDAISDADLDISINVLRDRVGVAHISNAFVTANGLNMQEEIRRERRVELAMEGLRYDDLLRWKTAEVELPKPILGVRLFAAEYPGVDPSILNFTVLNGEDSIIIVEPASNRHFDPAKHYLWPLPLTELGLNENLTQNPGWN